MNTIKISSSNPSIIIRKLLILINNIGMESFFYSSEWEWKKIKREMEWNYSWRQPQAPINQRRKSNSSLAERDGFGVFFELPTSLKSFTLHITWLWVINFDSSS